MTFAFTENSIREKCLPPTLGEVNKAGKSVVQKYYWHDSDDLKGFGMCCGAAGKRAWLVQAMYAGRTRRVVIGSYPAMSLTAAKAAAKRTLADIKNGIDPIAQKRAVAVELQPWQVITLREAVEKKAAQLATVRAAKRQAKSEALGIAQNEHSHESHSQLKRRFDLHASGLLDRTLISISVKDCTELYDAIAATGKAGMAKKMLKHLREVWNAVREETMVEGKSEMPLCPVVYMKLKVDHGNRIGESIPNLPAWYAKVVALDGVRRDLPLFSLFFGARIGDCMTARFENLLPDNVLRFYESKTNEWAKIPLSDYVVKLLSQRREENAVEFASVGGDGGWIFPRVKDGEATHLSTHAQNGLQNENSAHRGRDTFLTVGAEIGISDAVLDKLVPHKPSSRNTTRGYNKNVSIQAQRTATNKIAEELQLRMGITSEAAILEQNIKAAQQRLKQLMPA